jgi:hypothetical protein
LQFLIIPMVHMTNAGFYHEVTRLLQNIDIIVVEGVGRGAISTALTATYRVLRLRRVERLDWIISGCFVLLPYVSPARRRQAP